MDDLPLTLDATHPSATTAPAKPVAFAFATDPDTEDAFREGLSDHPDPQVWPGDLRTAMAALALAGEPPPRLIFVDLDGTPYPAGAIHELAAVCEPGTVVVALGSDGTARFSREALMAGVNDTAPGATIDSPAGRKMLAEHNIVGVEDFARTRGTDIEDPFAGDFYLGLVNRSGAAAVERFEIQGGGSIVERIETVTDTALNRYLPARLLLEGEAAELPEQVDDEALDRFEALFRRINGFIE